MFGGSFLAIDKKTFEQSLYYMIWNLGKFFTSKNSFITRNINHMKKNKNVHEILSCSVRFICNYQNKEFLEMEIKKVSNLIFISPTILKHEFFDRIRSLEKNDPVYHIIWMFVDILKAESMIILDGRVKEQINNQKEVESSNFY